MSSKMDCKMDCKIYCKMDCKIKEDVYLVKCCQVVWNLPEDLDIIYLVY